MRSQEFTGKTTQEAIDAGLAALHGGVVPLVDRVGRVRNKLAQKDFFL